MNWERERQREKEAVRQNVLIFNPKVKTGGSEIYVWFSADFMSTLGVYSSLLEGRVISLAERESEELNHQS